MGVKERKTQGKMGGLRGLRLGKTQQEIEWNAGNNEGCRLKL